MIEVLGYESFIEKLYRDGIRYGFYNKNDEFLIDLFKTWDMYLRGISHIMLNDIIEKYSKNLFNVVNIFETLINLSIKDLDKEEFIKLNTFEKKKQYVSNIFNDYINQFPTKEEEMEEYEETSKPEHEERTLENVIKSIQKYIIENNDKPFFKENEYISILYGNLNSVLQSILTTAPELELLSWREAQKILNNHVFDRVYADPLKQETMLGLADIWVGKKVDRYKFKKIIDMIYSSI
jgi:hypothetical protein